MSKFAFLGRQGTHLLNLKSYSLNRPRSGFRVSARDLSQLLRSGHIVLTRSILDEIHSEAVLSYPEECCGLLFCISSDKKKIVRALKMKNAFEESERRHRYAIDPKEFLLAEEKARAIGEELAAVYHSHPDAPSNPSRFDLVHAWPDLSYLVVEVMDERVKSTSSWTLKEGGREFVPELIEVRN